MARSLRVEIIGDAASYQRALATSSAKTESFGATVAKSLGKTAAFVGLSIGAAELFKFGVEAVKQAAQVEKFEEAVKANFGSASQSILDFADQAPKLGLVDDAALETAASFGILFKNLGIGHARAAEMTLGWEKLGTAIAAIKGQDPSEVIKKLTLAAAGNTRGLKAMGIVVDSTTIKTEALRLGILKQGQAMTPAIKAQAIYSLATKHLGEFQQQAAVHSDDLVNKQRVLSAEWDQARQQLGTALLPAITALVTVLADNLPGAIRVVTSLVKGLRPLFDEWKAIMLAVVAPIRIIIALLQGDWAGAWEAAKEPVLAAVEAIKGAFADPATWLVQAGLDIITGLWDGITTEWAVVTAWFATVYTQVLSYFTGALTWLVKSGTDVMTGLWTAITAVWNTIAAWFHTIQSLFVGFFTGALTWLTQKGENLFTGLQVGIKTIWSDLAGWLSGMQGRISAFFGGAIGWLVGEGHAIFSGLQTGLKNAWNTITGWLTQIPGFFRSFFGGAIGWLEAAGEAVIQGLWDGMKAVWNKVTGWLSGLGGAIAGLKGPPAKDYKLLQPAGEAIMAGLHAGMMRGVGPVLGLAAGLGGQIAGSFGGSSLSVGGSFGASGGFTGGSAANSGPSVVNLVVDGKVLASVVRTASGHYNQINALGGTT